jgi:hypothetical protein
MNTIKCGEHEYHLNDENGYLTLKSTKYGLTQSIAVIHPSGNIDMLVTPNNEIDVTDIIDSKRRMRV